MLEMIHEYALVQLEESGERALIEQAHAAYFLALAEDSHDQVIWLNRMAITRWAGLASWLDRMEAEHDNMRAALRWSLASDPANTGLRLCRALWWFWEAHGHWSEGLRWSGGRMLPCLSAGWGSLLSGTRTAGVRRNSACNGAA
jgi:non-specific serine/threonine protein kinase